MVCMEQKKGVREQKTNPPSSLPSTLFCAPLPLELFTIDKERRNNLIIAEGGEREKTGFGLLSK